MKRFVFAATLFMMVIILSLGAEETKKVEDSGKHFGQIKSIYCNATVAPEGQATIPVQFQAAASKGLRAGDLVAVDNIVGIMRFVPATGPEGFVQGSPSTEPGRKTDETQFTHILTRNIAVMETEVARSMWNALKSVQPGIGSDPTNKDYTRYRQGAESNPVQTITFCRACIFANFLSIQNGLVPCYYTDSTKNIVIGRDTSSCGTIYCDFSANGYRLPTEGEWEYFTRAGTTTPFSIDEPNYNDSNCNTCGVHSQLAKVANYCWSYTNYVGGRLPNPWNLKDVHGNVSEWCWDTYGEYPTGTVTDYQGPDPGNDRVHRGRGFMGKPVDLRSANRVHYTASYQTIGFRLVRTL